MVMREKEKEKGGGRGWAQLNQKYMSRIKTAIGKKIRWIRKKVLSYKFLRV